MAERKESTVPASERVYLQPAELAVVEGPARLETLLGSCVAITMRDPQLGLAAMCHAVQPWIQRMSGGSTCYRPAHFVDYSITEMLVRLERKGANRRRLEVKIFGGSEQFPDMAKEVSSLAVGRNNIEAAELVLAASRLIVVFRDVGGGRGRKLSFRTDTGEVMVKMLARVVKGAA